MTVGIPRGLFYYYYGELWLKFLDILHIPYIVSEETNQYIIDLGRHYATDEMCLSMKIYLGHIASLVGKCDVILIPRIDNFGRMNQTCTNFLAVYDIAQNIFDAKFITYDIDYLKGQTEEEAFKKLGKELGVDGETSIRSYHNALISIDYQKQKKICLNIEKLESKRLKILLVGHPYNIYDNFIGKPIIVFLEKNGIEIIYADLFHENMMEELGSKMQENLYFKYSKNLMGSIVLCEEKVDGIIFLTAFPCGIDSLVNELAFHYLKKPYIDLVMDELDSSVGLETRLESFIDILKRGAAY